MANAFRENGSEAFSTELAQSPVWKDAVFTECQVLFLVPTEDRRPDFALKKSNDSASPVQVQAIPIEQRDEDADDVAASDAAKAEGVAGSYDDLRRELGL
ncbi:MAG: hypothetical protein ACLQLG_19310 [Thermoguttaceae bacterium]